MTLARLTAFVGLTAAAAVLRGNAYELNAWPAFVLQKDASGNTASWEGAGPLLFSEPAPAPEKGTIEGLRPFYVKGKGGDYEKTDILYPLFYFRRYPEATKWSILQLINGDGSDPDATPTSQPVVRRFDVWPFYFSRETGSPVDSYHALLPVYGTIKYRLGFQRLSWVLFPLYVDAFKRNTDVTYTPFPFVKTFRGDENGFEIWPLFGSTRGPGQASHSYYLWPLIWDNKIDPGPDAPDGTAPGTQVGVLPLYTRETAPGMISENYLWPFFGYTERTSPYRYSEKRYFWPFLVQGRGDDRVLERWAPFYTYSNTKGSDSRWVVWPFWHRLTWADSDIAQSKTQFFYFVYWSLDQRSLSRPALAHAYKRHYWPLLSVWDNGAGTRQLQFLSPLEVFFPDNPDMRETWSPLFSVYRYDHRPSGEAHSSVLWNAVTWRRSASGGLSEFHLGPIIGMRRGPAGESWSILGFDFGAKPTENKPANR